MVVASARRASLAGRVRRLPTFINFNHATTSLLGCVPGPVTSHDMLMNFFKDFI